MMTKAKKEQWPPLAERARRESGEFELSYTLLTSSWSAGRLQHLPFDEGSARTGSSPRRLRKCAMAPLGAI